MPNNTYLNVKNKASFMRKQNVLRQSEEKSQFLVQRIPLVKLEDLKSKVPGERICFQNFIRIFLSGL